MPLARRFSEARERPPARRGLRCWWPFRASRALPPLFLLVLKPSRASFSRRVQSTPFQAGSAARALAYYHPSSGGPGLASGMWKAAGDGPLCSETAFRGGRGALG